MALRTPDEWPAFRARIEGFDALLTALRFIAERIEGNEDDTSRPYEDPLYGALHLAQHARAAIEEATG